MESGDIFGQQHRTLREETLLAQYRRQDSVERHLTSPHRRDRFTGPVYATQIAGATHHRSTTKQHEAARAELASFGADEDPPVLLRFLHTRNGVVIPRPVAPHDEGRSVLEHHYDRGYRFPLEPYRRHRERRSRSNRPIVNRRAPHSTAPKPVDD